MKRKTNNNYLKLETNSIHLKYIYFFELVVDRHDRVKICRRTLKPELGLN